MTTETPLDRAYAAMTETGFDADRMAYYQLLADSELYLWLEAEPDGDNIAPRTIESDGVAFVLAFDTEERLADTAQGAAARISLSGRALAHMLVGQGVGLGVNMGDFPTAMLLSPASIDWLVETLSADKVNAHDAIPVGFGPPRDAPPSLIRALSHSLTRAAGLAERAMFAQTLYEGGETGLLLALIGAKPEDHDALRGTVREAVVFSGAEATAVDLTFLEADDVIARQMTEVAMILDMTAPEPPEAEVITPPGMDPEKPPRLK